MSRLLDTDHVSERYIQQMYRGFHIPLWKKLHSQIQTQSDAEQAFKNFFESEGVSIDTMEKLQRLVGVSYETILRHMWRLQIPYPHRPTGGNIRTNLTIQQLRTTLCKSSDPYILTQYMREQIKIIGRYKTQQLLRMDYRTMNKLLQTYQEIGE